MKGPIPTIAFVCTANVCRSLMAHAIAAAEVTRRGLNVTIISAGLSNFDGVLIAREARLTCEKHQIWIPKFAASYIANVDLSDVVRALVMEPSHRSSILKCSSLTPDQVSLLGAFDPHRRGVEIMDPMGEDMIAFDQCYQRLRDCIIHYFDTSVDYGAPDITMK